MPVELLINMVYLFYSFDKCFFYSFEASSHKFIGNLQEIAFRLRLKLYLIYCPKSQVFDSVSTFITFILKIYYFYYILSIAFRKVLPLIIYELSYFLLIFILIGKDLPPLYPPTAVDIIIKNLLCSLCSTTIWFNLITIFCYLQEKNLTHLQNLA